MNVPGETFRKSWTAEVLKAPPLIQPARHFIYPQRVPGEEDALNRGALLLQVRPAHGGSFLATCALGFREAGLPTGIWACPNADDLLAVAGGYAYLLKTLYPEDTELLEQRPVTAVLPAPAENLLLLAGFHDVLAIGPDGVRWRTARLSWEGVTLQGIRDRHLHGSGWDMFADAELPFTVDLRTGAHEGGGYRR